MSDLSSSADLAYATTGEVAEAIHKKEISSREAVDYFLARVEALDKTINSVVTIDAERREPRPMPQIRSWPEEHPEDRCTACR